MTKAMAEIAGTAFGTGAAPWLMMIENYDTEFGLSPAAFEAVLAGKAPMTKAMAEIAGTAFGTGAAPWLMMIENYDTEVARLEAKAKAKADAKVAAKEATNA